MRSDPASARHRDATGDAERIGLAALSEREGLTPSCSLSNWTRSSSMEASVVFCAQMPAVAPPTGEVTLVFTDVQGSTALWDRDAEAMRDALELHDRILRDLIERLGGYEVKTEGDAFMVAFAAPSLAIGWCLEAQLALAAAPWSDALLSQVEAQVEGSHRGLRVRMGGGLGRPDCKPDPNTGRMDYFGPAVNRAARIGASGHGGQVVFSEHACHSAQVEDAVVVKLGSHALKGIAGKTALVQVLPPSLADRTFAPLRTLDTAAARAAHARRRERRGWWVALLALAGIATAGILAWDAWYRLHTTHYAEVVDPGDGPVALRPVDAERIRDRIQTWVVTTRGRWGPIVAYEVVDGTWRYPRPGEWTRRGGAGALLRDPHEIAARRYEVERGEGGAYLGTIATDDYDQVLWHLAMQGEGSAVYRNERGFPEARSPSGAAYVEFERRQHARGSELTVWFRDVTGQPRPASNKAWGVRHLTDPEGRWILRTWLSRTGEPQWTDGYAVAEATRDDQGRVVAIHYRDAAGGSSYRNGCAVDRFEWDESDRMVLEACEDGAGTRIQSRNQEAVITWAWDDEKRRITRHSLGVDGQPAMNSAGYSTVVAMLDARGNPSSFDFFDDKGAPVTVEDGYARKTSAYDVFGNVTEARYFDTDGQPVRAHGVAGLRTAYERGKWVEHTFLDENGAAMFRPKDGVMRMLLTYDEHGAELSRTFVDEEGARVMSAHGYARVESTYDERGNVIVKTYLDTTGSPSLAMDEWCTWRASYDDFGNRVELSFFAADGSPADTAGNAHRVRRTWDERGNPTKTAYFHIDGSPSQRDQGFHEWRARYNDAGGQIELTYHGADGGLTESIEGYARATRVHDDRGRPERVDFFDTDDHRVANLESGCATELLEYDERGEVSSKTCLGADGEVIGQQRKGAG